MPMRKINSRAIIGLALIASLAGCADYALRPAPPEPAHDQSDDQSDDRDQRQHIPPASATTAPKEYHAPGAVTTLTRAPDGSVIEVITNIPHKGTQP